MCLGVHASTRLSVRQFTNCFLDLVNLFSVTCATHLPPTQTSDNTSLVQRAEISIKARRRWNVIAGPNKSLITASNKGPSFCLAISPHPASGPPAPSAITVNRTPTRVTHMFPVSAQFDLLKARALQPLTYLAKYDSWCLNWICLPLMIISDIMCYQ